MQKARGFTLFELMITVAIVALVVAMGAPSVREAQQRMALSGSVQNSYFAFQQARSFAIRQNNDVTIDFSDGANWCIGMTDAADCDCATANSCTVDNVEQVLSSTDFPDITMQNVAFNADDQTVIDGVRGLAVGNAGSLELTNGVSTARVNLNAVGRVSVCIVAGDVGKYSAC